MTEAARKLTLLNAKTQSLLAMAPSINGLRWEDVAGALAGCRPPGTAEMLWWLWRSTIDDPEALIWLNDAQVKLCYKNDLHPALVRLALFELRFPRICPKCRGRGVVLSYADTDRGRRIEPKNCPKCHGTCSVSFSKRALARRYTFMSGRIVDDKKWARHYHEKYCKISAWLHEVAWRGISELNRQIKKVA